MPTPPMIARGVVGRKRPVAYPDNVREGVDLRSGRYGQFYAQALHQKNYALADEGSYFVVANPTSGTGMAGQAAPTGAPAIGATDTKPFIVIKNNESPSDPLAKRTYLEYFRVRVTAVGANGTNVNFTAILDTANAPRAPASYTQCYPVNCNMDDGSASVCAVYAGAGTVSTTATGRLFPNLQIRSVIPVVQDVYTVVFGATEFASSGLITTGTTQASVTINHPPLIIAPGGWALLYIWEASQSAANSYEWDVSMWDN
jgi:hypothetical protein